MSIAEMYNKAEQLDGQLRIMAQRLLSDAFWPNGEVGSDEWLASYESRGKGNDLFDFLGWETAVDGNDIFHSGTDAYYALKAITSTESAEVMCRLWERTCEYIHESPVGIYLQALHYASRINEIRALPEPLKEDFYVSGNADSSH